MNTYFYLYYGNRFGRERFQEAMKIAYRTKNDGADWASFKYMVYDIPNHPGTYAERYSQLGISYPFLSSFSNQLHSFLSS